MPPVRTDDVIAVLCSDIHLSHKAPPFRFTEPNWYAAMARTLLELKSIVEKFNNVPLICAGDIFDDGWREAKSPPELVNFAIKYLPTMYTIPGQHDLPHHRYDDIHKSAYWTLVEAGVVKDMPPGDCIGVGEVAVWAFPWGYEVRPMGLLPIANELCTKLAVIHAYCWKEGFCFPKVEEMKHAGSWGDKLQGYDCAHFGDNHLGFTYGKTIINTGTLMRRRADEREYTPAVGLLHRGGIVERYPLDTSMDCYADIPETIQTLGADLSRAGDFIKSLTNLAKNPFDFEQAVHNYLKNNEVVDEVKDILLKAMETVR